MKKLYLFLLMMCTTFISLQAQRAITGTVIDEDGEPLIGVNVIAKSSGTGTITDFDGNYALSVPDGTSQLAFSYIGFLVQTVDLGSSNVVNITLKEDAVGLDEVVVTALGIPKKEKSLGYSVQDLDGEGFTQAREANIVNALSGKVAGVQINSSSGAVGASSRIVIRGTSSITGNNEPLFVVDGVPIDNGNYGSSDAFGGFDVPNGIADINPDDIETMSVLKGPNAAALYGLRAANGVVLITTKSGKGGKGKGLGISINSTTSFEKPLVLPDFQNTFGQGSSATFFEFIDGQSGPGGVDESWGPVLDSGLDFTQWNSYDSEGGTLPWSSNPDNIKNFYETGITTNNSVSLFGGTDKAGFRLSAAAMNQKGMIPNTEFQRYNISGSSNVKIGNKLEAGVSINYVKTQSDNLPTGGYDNENPVQQMIWSGRQVNFEELENYEDLPLAAEGTAAEGTPANWNTVFQNNPYWVLNNNLNGLDKNRLIGNVNASYKINDMLGVNGMIGVDNWSSVTTEQKAIGSNEFQNGYYREIVRNYTEINSNLLVNFNKSLSDAIDLTASVGAARMDRDYNVLVGEAPELELPGIYNLSNVKSGVSSVLTNAKTDERINSLLGTAQLGLLGSIFLDFSARNDWSSLLPEGNNSFFYPSVSLSAVVSDFIEIDENILSFLKVRAGWSKVGSTGQLGPYDLEQTYAFRDDTWNSILLPFDPATLNNPNIKPESITGIEFGVDSRLFNNRIRFDFTYYNQVSQDLIVNAQVSAASGYNSTIANVGEMKNTGIEVLVGFTPVKTKDLRLDVDFNIAKNNNEVVSLGGLDALILGGQWDVDLQAREGEPFGVLYGPDFLRDGDGNIVHEGGLPQIDEELKILGDIQPDFTGGVTFSLNFKGINVGTLIDFKKGGDIHSMSTSWGRYAGVLQETLIGRDAGIVGDGVMQVGSDTEGNPIYEANNVVVNTEQYNKTAYQNSVGGSAVFDASFVKWRQLTIGYELPKTWFKKSWFQKAAVSLVARNLAILHRNTPHIDPESAFSSSDSGQGLEFGQLPSARSIGFNVKFDF